MLITGPKLNVRISVEFVAKRLSAVYRAEATSWRPEYKDNRDVLTILS